MIIVVGNVCACGEQTSPRIRHSAQDLLLVVLKDTSELTAVIAYLVRHHEGSAAARGHYLLLLLLQIANLTVRFTRFLVRILEVERFLLAHAAQLEVLRAADTLSNDIAGSARARRTWTTSQSKQAAGRRLHFLYEYLLLLVETLLPMTQVLSWRATVNSSWEAAQTSSKAGSSSRRG